MYTYVYNYRWLKSRPTEIQSKLALGVRALQSSVRRPAPQHSPQLTAAPKTLTNPSPSRVDFARV